MLIGSEPRHFVRTAAVESTNDAVRSGSFPIATILWTSEQQSGRGRQGRRWLGNEGGLAFSFRLQQASPERDLISRLPLLPLVVGLALQRAIFDQLTAAASDNRCSEEIEIKWPNDLILWRHSVPGKLAGILIESSFSKGQLELVVGIGINYASAPPELCGDQRQLRACSLFPSLPPRSADFDHGVLDLLTRFATSYNTLIAELFSDQPLDGVVSRVEERLFFCGREVGYLRESWRVVGLGLGGALLLESMAAGDKVELSHTEVEIDYHLEEYYA